MSTKDVEVIHLFPAFLTFFKLVLIKGTRSA